ncbi:MAG TPA: SPFH domain-containing protein [Thermoanaerobaculia bacterium]|nr:SPFH domain-containing protein [Thermoanaerobaculia bacterium]
MFSAFAGALIGLAGYFFVRCIMGGLFTVQQNERAVITSFGRAQRLPGLYTDELPMAEHLSPEHRGRYRYPQLRVIGPGGPYFKWPWQKVHKVDVAIRTVSAAYDPENPGANRGNTVLEAVTKDQLNIGVTGQIRYKVSEHNLYAFLFGVKNPIAHVMGYFVSILRERIANFEARPLQAGIEVGGELGSETETQEIKVRPVSFEGVSINDLRKNLNELNIQMDNECLSSSARYGIVLDASLITGIDPPQEIESALAAINTAHNEVSAELSLAQALADQKIEESKRAVEIETMRAQAEVQPLERLSEQLRQLKQRGPKVLAAYRRNARLSLLTKARRILTTHGAASGTPEAGR